MFFRLLRVKFIAEKNLFEVKRHKSKAKSQQLAYGDFASTLRFQDDFCSIKPNFIIIQFCKGSGPDKCFTKPAISYLPTDKIAFTSLIGNGTS